MIERKKEKGKRNGECHACNMPATIHLHRPNHLDIGRPPRRGRVQINTEREREREIGRQRKR